MSGHGSQIPAPSAPPAALGPPRSRARPPWPRRVLRYAGIIALSLVGAFVVVAFVVALAQEALTSSAPGDPAAAGVIDSDIVWSPDSRSIAFTRSEYGSRDDTRSGASDVFVANADGHRLRPLSRTPWDETVLGWLSDPPRVVYASSEGPAGPITVYARAPEGAAPIALGRLRTTDVLLALSHDARRALVGTPRLDPQRYVLVDLVRNTRRPLSGRVAYWLWLDGAWSPDDSMLAYLTDKGIVVLRGDRVLRRVPHAVSGALAWSPDGRRLAYGEGGEMGSLWLVRISDGARARLTGEKGTSNDDPAWAPDGGAIYYEHGSYDNSDGLRRIAPDGTGDTKISDDDWGDFFTEKNDRWLEHVRISPDGTKIAYLLGQRGAWKNWSLVGVMKPDGSGKTSFPGSP